MEITRLFDIIYNTQEKYPNKEDILVGKVAGKWEKTDIKTYISNAENIAYALIELGIKPNDKIATISKSRPEWNWLDMAIMMAGAINVPIYPNISESDYKYILNHADVRLVFVEGKELLRKIEHIIPDIPSISGIYTFNNIDEYDYIQKIIEMGKANPQHEEMERRKKNIKENDVATLIYTSGTTGFPKGVMLSHKNLLTNVFAIAHIPPVDNNSRALSFLPLSHVYERMLNYFYQYAGLSIYYAENIGTVVQDMQDIKPEMATTVPRMVEKIYDRIIIKGRKLKGIKKTIFFWAVNLGHKYQLHNKNGWFYHLKLKIADKLVFHKWREALGGELKLMVSGGAALQERLSSIFWAAGIPVLEGYGLSETSPVIAVSNYSENGIKFGTVGPPISIAEVLIAPDGEILVRGPLVMLGYFKNIDDTKAAIDKDNFFHTGDIGHIEPEGQLKITGRKKSIFKTSSGKYVSPEIIENKFKESPFIQSILILGENQKYVAALIVPDFEHLKNWCRVKKIVFTTNEEMINLPIIKKRIQREVDTYNTYFGESEKIHRTRLIGSEWSIQTGELTASLKEKRLFIQEKYASLVEELFK